jgi:hypothetical protein
LSLVLPLIEVESHKGDIHQQRSLDLGLEDAIDITPLRWLNITRLEVVRKRVLIVAHTLPVGEQHDYHIAGLVISFRPRKRPIARGIRSPDCQAIKGVPPSEVAAWRPWTMRKIGFERVLNALVGGPLGLVRLARHRGGRGKGEGDISLVRLVW